MNSSAHKYCRTIFLYTIYHSMLYVIYQVLRTCGMDLGHRGPSYILLYPRPTPFVDRAAASGVTRRCARATKTPTACRHSRACHCNPAHRVQLYYRHGVCLKSHLFIFICTYIYMNTYICIYVYLSIGVYIYIYTYFYVDLHFS